MKTTIPPTPEQILEFVKWLNSQINHSTKAIQQSQNESNFGREAMAHDMRDAYMQCLNWFTQG